MGHSLRLNPIFILLRCALGLNVLDGVKEKWPFNTTTEVSSLRSGNKSTMESMASMARCTLVRENSTSTLRMNGGFRQRDGHGGGSNFVF